MENAIPWLKEQCQLSYKDPVIQCVHAGLLIDPIELNDTYTMVHDHNIVLTNQYAGPLTIVGHIALNEPIWFAGDGETIQQLAVDEERELPKQGIICIDTGCGKGGKLTGMIISGNRYRMVCAH